MGGVYVELEGEGGESHLLVYVRVRTHTHLKDVRQRVIWMPRTLRVGCGVRMLI